ncbi:hypothetical protein LTR62_003064 [Meristemomyces frigidus]|uniref:2-dehydropantoate 2-reductase n=1 Tax=Meristemomyces frigidus TaxID=1508187 RepID=A0AAN7TKG5_9PEZI|nr:hypothetical protein LTR62_003064 [Meristemomyces frigidus]
MAPTVLVHGLGAVGSIYAYLLQKAGCAVTVVCRSNYDAVKSNGITIDSVLYGKGIRVHPTVVRSGEEAAEHGTFDYVLVTTKVLPGMNTPAAIAPVVTAGHTCIVLAQNGIAIEDAYLEAFPKNVIISAVVYLPTTQIEPGRISMGNMELLEVGTFPATAYNDDSMGAKQTVDTLVALLDKGGCNVHFYPDIQQRRWNKLLINATWNPICALTLSRDVAFLASSPAAEHLIRGVMLEVVAIAQGLGYSSISAEAADKQLKIATERLGGNGIEPSMLVDVLSRRRTEVEVILGNPIKVAKRVGVVVPRMETLYALTAALDESIAFAQPGKSLGGEETRSARAVHGSS